MNRFVEYENYVHDNQTDLDWSKRIFRGIKFADGIECADELNSSKYAGFPDWRVPNDKELESLVDRKRRHPASEFPGMISIWFWSAVSYIYPDFGWYVDLGCGSVEYCRKETDLAVRCVRGEAR